MSIKKVRVPMVELLPQLRALRLSGMAEYMEERNREAIEHQLSYMEFLSLLLQDEILRREQSRFKERIKHSGFRGDKTLEGFDFSFNAKINQALIKDLATGQFIAEHYPVLIIGPCGTGKSHLAQALGHAAIRLGVDVLFSTQSKVVQDLQTARATGTYAKMMKKLTQVQLLIIDDFGLKPLKSEEEEDIHDVVAERYEQRPTIVTSNLDFSEWADAFQNKLLAAATLDRLRHNAYEVALEGQSYRTKRTMETMDAKTVKKQELKNEEN